MLGWRRRSGPDSVARMPGKPTTGRRPAELPAPSAEHYADAVALAARAALPARVGNVRFGTAGWAHPALSRDRLFYPSACKTPEGRLRHYATHFRLVEVDASFYALLAQRTVQHWVDWTPQDFQFDVKAHPVFTGHPIDRRRLPADLAAQVPSALGRGFRLYPAELPTGVVAEIEARFFASLVPLLEARRLHSILLQFPPWFEATRGRARVLERLRERYPEAPFSVEFRHPSWLSLERRQRVVDLLRAQRLAYVVVDEPDVRRAGVPPVPLVTAERLAVVRFHGQNGEAWQDPHADLAERFNYLYAPAELSAWTDSLRKLSNEAEEVHAVFTNGMRDYAILGAKGLSAILGDSDPSGWGSAH